MHFLKFKRLPSWKREEHATPRETRTVCIDGREVEVRVYAPGASGGTPELRPDWAGGVEAERIARLAEYEPHHEADA